MEIEAESSEHVDDFGGDCERPVEVGSSVCSVSRHTAPKPTLTQSPTVGLSTTSESFQRPTDAVAQVL